MFEACYRLELGRRDYLAALDIQRRLVEKRKGGDIPDVLVFVEHPPTYTLGRSGRGEHLLLDESELAELGASFVATDRGGDITFHGPGQIVGYPIVDLKAWQPDVHRYLRGLEEVVMRALADFGVRASREKGFTGVWHSSGKVAAIGIRVSRWVASHGFALNVATDLAYFKRIVACGIVGRAVSSMEAILKTPVVVPDVRDKLARHFGEVFGREVQTVSEASLLQ